MDSHKNSKLDKTHKLGRLLIAATAVILLTPISLSWSAVPPTKYTKFTNIGSIANTRHNMMQTNTVDKLGNPIEISSHMDTSRNNYGEVCVYCHTPHGANQANGLVAPLWNRTIKATVYTTYADLGTTTLSQELVQPGSASLTCLSCHDGQTAVDSIVNMPGSGLGNISQQTVADYSNGGFLDQWPPSGGGTNTHVGLNSTDGVQGNGQGSSQGVCSPTSPGPGWNNVGSCGPLGFIWVLDGQGCLSCHSDVGSNVPGGAGQIVDFRLFNIGTDLRNDHPIGVTFPTTNGPGTDWNTPANAQGSSMYFMTNDNGRMDKEEIRTYEGKVECASCHDPHGVPNPADGNHFNKTFLRKQNTDGSAVCLTCHNK